MTKGRLLTWCAALAALGLLAADSYCASSDGRPLNQAYGTVRLNHYLLIFLVVVGVGFALGARKRRSAKPSVTTSTPGVAGPPDDPSL